MKRPYLLSLYTLGILVIFFGMAVHAPLSVYFGSVFPAISDGIKAWKELLLVGLTLVAMIVITRRNAWKELLKDRLVQMCIVYCLLHLALVGFASSGVLPTVAGLMIDLRFVVFFLLCYGLVRLEPEALRPMMNAVTLGAALVVGFGILQLTILPKDVLTYIGYNDQTIRPYTTIDRNTDFIRINSTLRGPNPLGALCVVYLSFLGAYVLRRSKGITKYRRWIIIGAAAGSSAILLASFSRSAYLAVIVAAIMLAVSLGRRPNKKVIAIGSAVTVAVVAAVLLLQSSDWYSNVILHQDPESTVAKKSDAEHAKSVRKAVASVATHPLGSGIGSTGSASLYGKDKGPTVENYYLFVAHESGWAGLVLFISIVIMTQIRLWRQRTDWRAYGLFASGVGLAIIGLLLPVWADDTVSLIWWGLAGGILGSGYGAGKSKQETARTA